MPIYEFRCKACGHVFEYLILRKAEEENISCPACGARKVEKIISAFSTIASGSATQLGSFGPASSCDPSCRSRGGGGFS